MEANSNNYTQIENIIKTNRSDQTFLLRYYSRLPIELQLKLETNKKKIFHSLREKYSSAFDYSLLGYCSLILGIKVLYSQEKAFSIKKFDDMSIDEIRDISMIKIARSNEKEYQNASQKRHKTLHYWAVIKMMRSQKPKPKSFEKISIYLKKTYSLNVSHNFLATLWREIELNQKI